SPSSPRYTLSRCLYSCLSLGNTLFEATIPHSVTFIMRQFGYLTISGDSGRLHVAGWQIE
ncbi:MAG: hypothetical protein SVP26_03325, partial [Chloroflexota bacterium]|nr:hypothetical protein [Chloroflexota bacterium]